jgi:secondary thiamine-phosphate synthase enzyme
MRVARSSTEVRTPSRVAVVNVTSLARRALEQSRLRDGMTIATVPHTTCGLIVNEDEAGLKDDLVRLVTRLLEPLAGEEPFHHDRIDNNARAHLMASLLGHAVILPVADGDLGLGTWQSLFLLEMDGPRRRRLDLMFVGD